MTTPVRDLLWAKSLPLRNEAARSRQRRRLAGEKAPETLNALVMMCDFSDSLLLGRHGTVPGDFPAPRQTDRYYAAHDSVYFSHMMSKVADYFTTVSGGRLVINATVHARAINLPGSMAFYGDHPERGEQSLLMAAQMVDSLGSEVDFSAYDTIVLIHAGAGEETDILGDSPEQVFSTYLTPADFAAAVEDSILAQPYLPAPGFPTGTGIDRVLILPETAQQDPIGSFGGGFGNLGVYCFEFGLHLGMLSLSDFTPAGRPDSQGIGQYGLMGYGLFVGLGFIPPHPCAYNKMLMGWLDPYEVEAGDPARYFLTPAEEPGAARACARVDISGREFWLLEYRLQDPNGDRRYTFGDDKNGNGVPDFYDMDSSLGNGVPTGKFDAATDSLERVTDAEWDFAMSENSERQLGELGWGSGVYVWHIDEGVIESVFDAPTNLFNADSRHKSVDLEEADGIQDLDSNEPSAFALGSDDDSFRGEFNHEFSPTTTPGTETAGGAWTGVAFTEFSDVVADSNAYVLYVDPGTDTTYWAFDYADSISFRLARSSDGLAAPALSARRQLPSGTDLRGSHVLLGDLDDAGDQDEIILAGHDGEVFVLDGDLNEYLDRDANPATMAPFVVGTRLGVPVAWNLPPALGDVDGDGQPEIVLTGADGLFVFKRDGTAVRNPEAGSLGLYADVAGCRLPPVLVADISPGSRPVPGLAAQAVAVSQTVTGAALHFFRGTAAEEVTVELGAGVVPAPPVARDEFLAVALADTAGADHRLVVLERSGGLMPTSPPQLSVPLAGMPGPLPLTVGVAPESDPTDPVYFVTVIDTAGRGETVFFDRNLASPRHNDLWPVARTVRAPLGLGGAYVGDEILGRVGPGGDWLLGWPRRPAPGGMLGDGAAAGQPLLADLQTAGAGESPQFVFPVGDGRIMAADGRGNPLSGWPLAGPADLAGTPGLGQVAGLGDADLVAVGTFARITGTQADGSLATESTATVSIWRDVAAADPIWGLYGGSIWRSGTYDRSRWPTGTTGLAETGLIAGSHYCYPSPLTEGPLQVSGRVGRPARARVLVYNLSGEEVTHTGWQEVGAIDPFVVSVDLSRAVTGLYLCRLVVDSPSSGTEDSVTQFAIVR